MVLDSTSNHIAYCVTLPEGPMVGGSGGGGGGCQSIDIGSCLLVTFTILQRIKKSVAMK